MGWLCSSLSSSIVFNVLFVAQSMNEVHQFVDTRNLHKFLIWYKILEHGSKHSRPPIGGRLWFSWHRLSYLLSSVSHVCCAIKQSVKFLESETYIKCSLVNSKRSFYRSVNAILGKVLSSATIDVILHLINCKCVPVLLYGLEVCPLNKGDIQSLDFCVNQLLMKWFCTNNLSVIEECRHYFNIALPSELLCMCAEKFMLKLNANCG